MKEGSKSGRGGMALPVIAALALAMTLEGCGGQDRDALARTVAPTRTEVAGSWRKVGAGELRQLEAFPLFELRYGPAYDLGAMVASLPRRSVPAGQGFACTCFAATDEVGHRVLGRNFDWDAHPVLVLYTAPRDGYASVSLVDIHYLGYSAGRSPLDFPEALLNAPALPFDGMNEKGLAVGMMAVPHAEGDADPSLPEVSDLGLIRLILDRAANLDEALTLARGSRLRFEAVPLHYLIADRSGASAIVEYVGGKAVVWRSEKAWQVSTNFLFAEVAAGDREAACWRYAAAQRKLTAGGGRLPSPAASMKSAGGAFALLAEVSQPSTRWSAVYDLSEPTLSLVLGRDWERRRDWALPPP